MNNFIAYTWTIVVLLSAPTLASSPYAGMQDRSIKALSDAQIQNYLAGKGMGLAMAAELNGYPGPAHVLEYAEVLQLSSSQKQKTQSIFEKMQSQAKALGKVLVEQERELDHLFKSQRITSELLAVKLAEIGKIQVAIRQAHLQAHLAEIKVLSDKQVRQYMQLRGYTSNSSTPIEHQHSFKH